jgi:hypothetical protein
MLEPSATSSGSSATSRRLIATGLTKPAGGSLTATAEWVGAGIVRRATSGTRGLVRTTGTPLAARSAKASRTAASAGTTASLCVRCDLPGELPQVVTRGTAVRSNRRLLTLARDAANATHRRPLRLWSTLRRHTALRILDARRHRRHAGRNQLPLTRFGEGILELLSEIPAFHERVDVRGKRAGLVSVGRNRAGVLSAPEDGFFLFLALGFVSPYRHGDGHEDSHDGHHDEQSRHRVTSLAAPIGLTS